MSALSIAIARCRWRTILLVTAAVVMAPPVSASGWGGSLGVSTDYVFRGLTQSAHDPSVQADIHYSADSGWFLGLWGASVKREPDDTTAEINAYLGYAWVVADAWSARMSAVHYTYPSTSPRRLYDYDELAGTLAYRNLVFLTIAASPNASSEPTPGHVVDRAAYAYDLTLHQPLMRALSLNAGLGYRDLRRLYGTGYSYWNAGLGYDLGAAQLNLSYIGTDGTARSLFTDAVATNRWVATLLWRY